MGRAACGQVNLQVVSNLRTSRYQLACQRMAARTLPDRDIFSLKNAKGVSHSVNNRSTTRHRCRESTRIHRHGVRHIGLGGNHRTGSNSTAARGIDGGRKTIGVAGLLRNVVPDIPIGGQTVGVIDPRPGNEVWVRHIGITAIPSDAGIIAVCISVHRARVRGGYVFVVYRVVAIPSAASRACPTHTQPHRVRYRGGRARGEACDHAGRFVEKDGIWTSISPSWIVTVTQDTDSRRITVIGLRRRSKILAPAVIEAVTNLGIAERFRARIVHSEIGREQLVGRHLVHMEIPGHIRIPRRSGETTKRAIQVIPSGGF